MTATAHAFAWAIATIFDPASLLYLTSVMDSIHTDFSHELSRPKQNRIIATQKPLRGIILFSVNMPFTIWAVVQFGFSGLAGNTMVYLLNPKNAPAVSESLERLAFTLYKIPNIFRESTITFGSHYPDRDRRFFVFLLAYRRSVPLTHRYFTGLISGGPG
jgi:hypothetical protein